VVRPETETWSAEKAFPRPLGSAVVASCGSMPEVVVAACRRTPASATPWCTSPPARIARGIHPRVRRASSTRRRSVRVDTTARKLMGSRPQAEAVCGATDSRPERQRRRDVRLVESLQLEFGSEEPGEVFG
jgi:hypothetical protein